ncbi:MAG: AAA family ATPase [Thermodesulfovibrionia bacterium]|nr:AAA family ATPase [Thermodesulfovibrionia bacterium]
MYAKHFGLKILPFENVPDPMFFFDQGDHARIRNRITDSLKAGRGLTVVIGPIGSGKTTLSQMIKSDFSHNIKLIWMAVPPGNSIDLFLFIAQALGLKPSTSERVFVIRDIRDALLKINSEGSKCLVIVDESHLMSDDTLNGIRLLNNLEEGSTKFIQILLLGQEELMETINRPEMEPFKQRIATLEIIGKMNAEKRRLYISHRIQVAGGHPSIFADTGWEALDLALGSEGTPRIINSLCDRSLNVAFEREKTKVDVYDVYEATQGMGLSSEIFHHVVALKNIERKKQTTSIGKKGSIKEPETMSKGPIPSFIKEPDESDKNVQSTIHQTTQEGSEISFSKSNIANKSLKIPILFLTLSIVALILSIFFYCQRSGSLELLTCLQDLIGF